MLHHLIAKKCKLGFKPQARIDGLRVCVLNYYLFGKIGFLPITMPLGHAQVNETPFLIAWTEFSLRKCRYGFSVSDYQRGGFPMGRDIADCMD